MAIETSALQMGISMDDNKRRSIGSKPGSSHSNHTVTKNESSLPPSPVAPGPNETPIANLFSTPSSTFLPLDSNENVQPRAGPSQGSFASSTVSVNHLSMVLPDEEAVEDDWAQSVLAAADTSGTWSAKNVMKFFGGGS